MSSCSFGQFELDTDTRQLRLRGEEICLQPRVFDLLAFLVAHRERVVDKEELLSTLWPGVVVTDASLQRAVSLLRSALRQGGMENAIRTYARRGYRFCPHPDAPATVDEPSLGDAALARAHQLAAARAWTEAVHAFARADRDGSLAGRDLEAWAMAAQCAGRLADAVDPLERAAAAYAADHATEATARAHLLLARIQLESQKTAIARGCMRRAASLLGELALCEQHGHLAWMTSRYCCYVGELAEAVQQARRTIDIGRRLRLPDLEVIGLLYQGVATQASGEARLGIEMQDEAAAAVLAGNVSPLIGGIVYCGVIAGCCNAGDWPRAGQWTEHFRRWCERANLRTFAGSCILHRAEVFSARGELGAALQELSDGAETLRRSAPWAEGDAYRVLGDLYLARGEFERCEEAYRQSHEHGWDPYPGYAMLQFYRGDVDAALRGLQRACEPSHWVAGERRALYLAYLATIAAVSQRTELAQQTLATLDALAAGGLTGAVQAWVTRARAELALAAGDIDTAASQFAGVARTLNAFDLPLEAALVRLRLACALTARGDDAGAALEVAAARSVFSTTRADWYLKLCDVAGDQQLDAPPPAR